MGNLKTEKNEKGDGYKVYITPETSEIRATIRWKDKNGNEKTFTSKPLKIIRRIYFIFHVGGDFEAAAKTRKREIEAYDKQWSYVFIYKYDDLWEIKDFVDKAIKKVKENSWLQTTEVCFFSHAGTDGPVGNTRTSKYNLADETGREAWDKKQMSLDGWKQINFNFDPNNSIAVFYGCKGVTFAENFIDIQNVQYTAANGGGSADSESYKDFDSNWFTFLNEDIYYVSPTAENGEIAPMEIIKRGREKWNRSIENEKIVTNITLDRKGNIIGKGKEGTVMIKKSDIKYYK